MKLHRNHFYVSRDGLVVGPMNHASGVYYADNRRHVRLKVETYNEDGTVEGAAPNDPGDLIVCIDDPIVERALRHLLGDSGTT